MTLAGSAEDAGRVGREDDIPLPCEVAEGVGGTGQVGANCEPPVIESRVLGTRLIGRA
jgi:hypothetical protein